MAAGRPSTYTDEIAEEICERLAGGESVLAMCREDHMPPQSVIFQWLHKHKEFAEKYALARESWAQFEFERMMEIADTPLQGEKIETSSDGKTKVITGDMTEHRRLQVDTRKWALARMNGRRFGDRTAHEHSGPGGEALEIIVTRVGEKKGLK